MYRTHHFDDPTGPTVVYLHGNSGCRLEGDEIADQYLRRGMGFFSVDFGGCGISDGGMVTLGYREREDVEVVLDYLKSQASVSFVCLYGRSMGAATALLVAADDRYYHHVAGLVLDSCYMSVREIALDLARKYAEQIPLVHTESVAGNAVDALREAVVDTAGFDLDTIDVLRAAPLCQVRLETGTLHGIGADGMFRAGYAIRLLGTDDNLCARRHRRSLAMLQRTFLWARGILSAFLMLMAACTMECQRTYQSFQVRSRRVAAVRARYASARAENALRVRGLLLVQVLASAEA